MIDAHQHVWRIGRNDCTWPPLLQAISATDWILQPEVQPALAALVDARLSLDGLIQPRHLPVVAELADRWPKLATVVDHAAKPAIAQGAVGPWREQLQALAG